MILATVLKKYRIVTKTGAVSLAGKIGIHEDALRIFEGGKPINSPDLAKIMTWLLSKGTE